MARVRLRVVPGAREDAVIGWQESVLRVRVRAPAERAKANEAVCRLVASVLGIPLSAVAIVRGASSREKIVVIDGIDDREMRERITSAVK